MAKVYEADIKAVNADLTETNVQGTAKLVKDDEYLTISIQVSGTSPNIMHWSHFHGFSDGRKGRVPTMEDDTNQDGYLDLWEVYEVSGKTMVPFDNAPQDLKIPHDNYGIADAEGNWSYEAKVPLKALKESFEGKFGTADLELDKKTVLIHGVSEDIELPDTVEGTVQNYGPHTTLPIGVGELNEVK